MGRRCANKRSPADESLFNRKGGCGAARQTKSRDSSEIQNFYRLPTVSATEERRLFGGALKFLGALKGSWRFSKVFGGSYKFELLSVQTSPPVLNQ